MQEALKMETNPLEKVNWLRLCRSKNVSFRTFHALIKIYGSASAVINKIEQIASLGHLKRQVTLAATPQIEQEIEKVIKYGAQFIYSNEMTYPQPLLKIPDYPPILTILGNKDLIIKENIVAIVGARNASINGMKFASVLAQELGRSGNVIASGLARGIDFAAHQNSIKTGSIAFIAGGIDQIYPRENAQIYRALSEQGVIVSELPIGTAPRAQHFPQRNRLISGIANVVAVIEAAKKSGSLITARFATLQEKVVFAVPGSPFDTRYVGTNCLLKQGARFLESPTDILEHLGQNSNTENLKKSPTQELHHSISLTETELDKYRTILLGALNYSPVVLDEIMHYTAIPIDMLNLLLVELELAGKIERSFGNHFNLVQ